MNKYLQLLKDKKVGVVANHTSLIQGVHLVDTLISLQINITKIFSPEHGFKGNKSDGAKIADSEFGKAPIQIISLYGDHKKPGSSDISDLDILIFDMQDVGVRCYTYISTMTYVMEACAENNLALIVLDRPNPHLGVVDGPVLKKEFTSFVGLHPVPLVYGMTLGEYALMINHESWLKNAFKCKLKVVPMKDVFNMKEYVFPVPPSPNLPNMHTVKLYPSLCLFEGTDVSVGRGTENPFQVIGKPGINLGNFYFTPKSIPGVSDNPPHLGEICRGYDLRSIENQENRDHLSLEWILEFYEHSENKETFFNSYFSKLAGTDELKQQIEKGLSEDLIRRSWQNDLNQFKGIRKKYLLYPRK